METPYQYAHAYDGMVCTYISPDSEQIRDRAVQRCDNSRYKDGNQSLHQTERKSGEWPIGSEIMSQIFKRQRSGSNLLYQRPDCSSCDSELHGPMGSRR